MSSIKILIVEDERLVADDLRETLELLGYEVPAPVTTGEEAFSQVAHTKPDLVLMDIRLAGEMDGVEASHLIQSLYRIPVVYLTANADRPTLDRVKASHPFGYILKPFNEKILATTIEIALARHQAESDIQRALAIAQASQQTAQVEAQQKAEYFALVAHELRNPLTAIKFAAEILQSQAIPLSEEHRQRYIQRIQTATNSLNDLLEDVLLLEKTSTNSLQCSLQPVNLNEFLQEMVEVFQLTSGQLHQLILTASSNDLIACLDEKLLWHIFSNLLSNAIKYSPRGGTIAVTLSDNANYVQVAVKDNGIGIPLEAQSRLFQPFQRAGNVGQISGTGLGLAIAKKCVDLQGGNIAVESAIDVGTTFTIAFPRANR